MWITMDQLRFVDEWIAVGCSNVSVHKHQPGVDNHLGNYTPEVDLRNLKLKSIETRGMIMSGTAHSNAQLTNANDVPHCH